MGIISYVKEEIQVIRERDPAIKSNMEVFLYPSFQAILRYRVAHKLYRKKHYFLARWVSQRAARKTGIEIHPRNPLIFSFYDPPRHSYYCTVRRNLFQNYAAGTNLRIFSDGK